MEKMARTAVFIIYLAYLVVIVIALSSSLLPLRWTVLACLSLHFVGLIVGSVVDLGAIYPKVLGPYRPLIIFWDVVQAVVLILLITPVRFYIAAAVIAIIGIVGCFYKFYKVHASGIEPPSSPLEATRVDSSALKRPRERMVLIL
jgi:hypothetical protein